MKNILFLIWLFVVGILGAQTGVVNIASNPSNQPEGLVADENSKRLYLTGDYSEGFLSYGTDVQVWRGYKGPFWGKTCAYAKFKEKMYATGCISYMNPDGTWHPHNIALVEEQDSVWIPAGQSYANSCAMYGLLASTDYLYLLGIFDTIDGIPAKNIARWDGTQWDAPYPPMPEESLFDSYNTGYFYKGDLYIGGNFDGGPKLKDIARWNGSAWTPLFNGLSGGDSWVSDFTEYKGDLIVSGRFRTAWGDPGNCIARWDGSQWLPMGGGILPTQVWKAVEYKGELWVAGSFTQAGGVQVQNLAVWDGQQWRHPGLEFDNAVLGLAVMGDDLYIAGGFWHVNGLPATYVVKYNATTGISAPGDPDRFVKCHPNPATGFLTLHPSRNLLGHIREVSLHDTQGKTLIRLAAPSHFQEETEIPLGGLTPGLYYLQCTTDYGVFTEKVVKE